MIEITRTSTVIANRPVVEMIALSRRFEIQRERYRSFQESFIRIFRRQAGDPEQAQDENEFWPLREITLSVYPGDCIGVIGPNGTGKSTLLKVIAGILSPTSGSLSVHGRVSSLLELGTGFHPDLTGRENIFLNGSIYGMSRAQMNKRLKSIIEYAELGDFIDTPIKHYSSGMYVRLGFAVAIHTNPDLLLVDEVLAVGDAIFQRKCMESIQKFRSRGGTLLLVSHDLATIQSLCDRVIWIEDGRIQAEGNATDVVMAYLSEVAQKEEARHQAALQRALAEQAENGQAESGDEFTEEKTERESDQNEEAAREKEPIRRWGTGKVRIAKVEFCGEDGEPRFTYHNGEAMTVRLHYEAAEMIEKPVFGIAIYHQNGAHICGPNTKFGELEIASVQGQGVVSYHIPALPFLPGNYLVSAAVVNQHDTETYDFLDRLAQFYVYPGVAREQYGLISLGGGWALDASVK